MEVVANRDSRLPQRSTTHGFVAGRLFTKLSRASSRRAWIAAALLAWSGVAGAESSGAFAGRRMPYEAFEKLAISRRNVGGGALEIVFAPGRLAVSRRALLDWIAAAARAVTAYYGRFPVPRVRVLVIAGPGRGIRSGTTYGDRGAAIKVTVGSETQADDLTRDWVMTHEMVHLALPQLVGDHDWLGEGIATYVEPIGRVQAGSLAVEKVWSDLVDGLPKGLPKPEDRGLDGTPTWGRTYWGGALFCLLSDIEIRQRTGNRRGLEDSLRAVNEAGGDVEQRWKIEKVFEVGDRASGVGVLRELYDRMKDAPVDVDLAHLWTQLGVKTDGGTITFDDGAPLAAIRRAITDRHAPPRSASALDCDGDGVRNPSGPS